MKRFPRSETSSKPRRSQVFGIYVALLIIGCLCTTATGQSFSESSVRLRELEVLEGDLLAVEANLEVDDEPTVLFEEDPNLFSYDPAEETVEVITSYEEEDLLDTDDESIIIEDETALPTVEELEEPEALDEVEFVEPLEYTRRKLSTCDLHQPLACNEGLEGVSCSSFSSLVSSMTDPSEKLVVPCGACVEVDITDGSALDLAGGMLLEGKLYFPPTSSVTIRTKFVWVVGILKMDTPNVGNKVTFKMYGDEFQVYENSVPTDTCGVDSEKGTCNMGSKVIAVMGGKLDIAGTEPDCPSWEKLRAIGQESVRPFKPPCENGECWSEDVIQLRGACSHSGGHTNALGKYTLACPIKSTGVHIGGGTNLGIKFENMGQPVTQFEYPVDQHNPSKALELTVNGACRRAGHTRHFNKCTIYCPIQPTALVRHGHGMPLTFTSVKPPRTAFQMPANNGVGVNLKIASSCGESGGHTRAWGRCVLACRVQKTANYGRGSPWSKLLLTSRYVEPAPFVYPEHSGKKLSLTTSRQAQVSWGHVRHMRKCVLWLPLARTANIRWGNASPVVLTNPATDNSFTASGVMHWAWRGSHMFYYPEGYTPDTCSQAAIDFNAAFSVGDSLEVSHLVEQGFSDNTFEIDRVMHWAHASKWFFFFPSNKDKDTCADTAEDFKSKFKPGYNIDISTPEGPPGGDTVQVDGVHHWAWAQRGLFFFPSESDPATCAETASDFSSKFPRNYGIEVSNAAQDTSTVGQVALASKGIHHWSWRTSNMFLFSDDTAADFNAKFPPGSQIKVSYFNTYDVNGIQISPEAAKCWKPGTEILLTSHTRNYRDQQVRTITSADETTGQLTLDEPIAKPVSLTDHSDFAVEVASLNRRIVFDAESDANDDAIGGHLVVHHTSTGQHIEGVEIRNFGQQGRLGKYPLHFHMCKDSPDSVVKKNIVRNSNQRGYVVHLTNNVTLEDNVAFDITGHCYFIEDGAEIGNVFRRNLGSGIKVMPAERVSQLSATSGRTETDGDSTGFNGASVFWISNPTNYFYGNVAAGGDKNGYWFETHSNRMFMNLAAFEDNEVHSSAMFAFSVYKPGYRPKETAYIRNLKAYRNSIWGAFLHATTNIYFDGGLFADNGGKDAMISRGDNIVFDGTTFVGQSPFATDNGKKVAIHLDPVRFKETVIWEHRGYWKGTTVKNVQFYNHSQPMKFFSHQSFVKAYNAPHYIENVWSDKPSKIDGCMSNDPAIDDLQIEIVADNNGDVTPTGTAGFLVSPKFAPMVGNCQAYNDCLQFCEGACLRTVTVIAGNAAFDDDLNMIVTRTSDGQTLPIVKKVRGQAEKHDRFFSAYTVALPKDQYTIHFESPSSPGTIQWPKFAAPVLEAAPSCTNHLVDSDLVFSKPDSSRSDCDELIYNGNLEGPSWGSEGWHARHHSIEYSPDGGFGGSGGVSTVKYLSEANWPSQNLDATCIEADNEYEITFSYKTLAGDATNIPVAAIQMNDWDASAKSLANKGQANPTRTSSTSFNDGWTTLQYRWTADEKAANAGFMKLYISGGAQKIMLDNISFTKVASGRRERRRLRGAY